MAVSPLLPRSPSNINANITAAKARSLTVRNSATSISISTSGKPAQPKQEFDLAEKMNEEIANKYVKGKSYVSM
jgi:hypothetical protein